MTIEASMYMILFAIFAISSSPAQDAPDIAGILDSLYEPIQDVTFEFEGAFTIAGPDEPGGSNSPSVKPYDEFSGSFSFRRDGATKQESFHRQYPAHAKKGQPVISEIRMSTLKGKTIRYDEMGGTGSAETDVERFIDYFDFGSAGRLFLVRYLKAFARYPKKRVIHEGTADVDGHSCEVFSFVWGKDFEKPITDASGVERFYLDFQRGGHPIKVEICTGSRIEARIVGIKLESFQDREGHAVWLPVYGRYEAGDRVGDPPTNTEIISVMRGSVRINAGLSDEHFRLRFKDGTPIKDGVTHKVVRSGKDVSEPPVNLAQAQEQLRRQIQEAEAQGKELRANSLARGGGWTNVTWLPWTVALLMTIVLCVMLIRQRMGA